MNSFIRKRNKLKYGYHRQEVFILFKEKNNKMKAWKIFLEKYLKKTNYANLNPTTPSVIYMYSLSAIYQQINSINLILSLM